MDAITRWTAAGSLAWLAVAVAVILGTHGASFGAQTDAAIDTERTAVVVGSCPPA